MRRWTVVLQWFVYRESSKDWSHYCRACDACIATMPILMCTACLFREIRRLARAVLTPLGSLGPPGWRGPISRFPYHPRLPPRFGMYYVVNSLLIRYSIPPLEFVPFCLWRHIKLHVYVVARGPWIGNSGARAHRAHWIRGPCVSPQAGVLATHSQFHQTVRFFLSQVIVAVHLLHTSKNR